MTSKIDLNQFKKTEVIKKLSKSKSSENLTSMDTPKRGRKSKYNTPEERLEARRQQQKEYRQRKKQELEELKKIAQFAASTREAQMVTAEKKEA